MSEMRTAYALHFSQGKPVRMILTTELLPDGNGDLSSMRVTTTECDFDWKEIPGTSITKDRQAPKGSWLKSGMRLFHEKFRNDQHATYNWRFEIYHPFSDTL
jgi:hypothetical protein